MRCQAGANPAVDGNVSVYAARRPRDSNLDSLLAAHGLLRDALVLDGAADADAVGRRDRGRLGPSGRRSVGEYDHLDRGLGGDGHGRRAGRARRGSRRRQWWSPSRCRSRPQWPRRRRATQAEPRGVGDRRWRARRDRPRGARARGRSWHRSQQLAGRADGPDPQASRSRRSRRLAGVTARVARRRARRTCRRRGRSMAGHQGARRDVRPPSDPRWARTRAAGLGGDRRSCGAVRPQPSNTEDDSRVRRSPATRGRTTSQHWPSVDLRRSGFRAARAGPKQSPSRTNRVVLRGQRSNHPARR